MPNGLALLTPPVAVPAAAQGYAPLPKSAGAASAQPSTPYAFWGAGFGDFGSNGGNGNAATLDRSVGGFVLGGDTRIDGNAFLSNWRIGIAGGYSNDSLTVADRASNGTYETYFGGLYAGAQYGAVDVKLGVLGGGTQTNIRRTVALSNFVDTEHSSYGGTMVQAFGELGYKFALARGFIEPVLQGAVIHIDQDGYHETGGAAALSGFGRSTDVETTTLGVKAETTPFAAYPITARAFLGWQHAFGDVNPRALVSFEAGSSAFSVIGAPIDHDAVVAQAGPRLSRHPQPDPRHQLHRPSRRPRLRQWRSGPVGI